MVLFILEIFLSRKIKDWFIFSSESYNLWSSLIGSSTLLENSKFNKFFSKSIISFDICLICFLGLVSVTKAFNDSLYFFLLLTRLVASRFKVSNLVF